MRVSIETTSGLERKMTVAVPSASFEEQVEQRLRSTAQQTTLPGFRPGKVPLKEIRRRFGPSVRREVASELVQSSFNDALQQENLDLAGQATINLVNVEPHADLEYVATLEVLPEIRLADFRTLRIGRPETRIEASDIDAMVRSLREQKSHWHPVQRAAQADDRVGVVFSVKVDGESISEEDSREVGFVAGRGNAFAELDAAVVGMVAGETRAFPVTVPDDHHDAALRGREAVGEVTLDAVDERHLPELDDAFFDQFDVKEADDGASRLDLFRADVQGRMQAELDAALRNVAKREVMKTLAQEHDFELPKAMLASQDELAAAARTEGGEVSDAARALAAGIVERRARLQLVVREIVARQSLQPDDDRVSERIEQIADSYERPDDIRNWIYGDEEQLERITTSVVEEQVVDYVLSQANVVPVPMSYADVVSGQPLPPLPAPPPAAETDEAPATADAGEQDATAARNPPRADTEGDGAAGRNPPRADTEGGATAARNPPHDDTEGGATAARNPPGDDTEGGGAAARNPPGDDTEGGGAAGEREGQSPSHRKPEPKSLLRRLFGRK